MPQSARQQDTNGFLLVKGCPISSYGVFQYSAAQVGMKDGDPNRVVNVFRPESAVNDPDLIATLQNVPLINDHEMLSGFQDDAGATAPEEYGIDGVLFDVAYQQPWLRGDVKVFTRKMQSDLEAGKKDLSLGYTCDFVVQSGTYDGTPYEVVQTNMRGNHIALVSAGRVPGAKVLDHRRLCFDHLDITSTPKERQMAKRKVMDSDVVANLRAQLKALLPAFEQFLNEEAAEPAHADPAAVPAEAAPAAVAEPVDTTTVDPTAAAAPPAAVAEPAAAAPAGGDLAALITQLETVLTQLKAAMGGGGEEAAPEGGEGGEASAAETPPPENKEGDEMPAALQDPNAAAEGGDAVEGLAEDPNSQTLNVDNAGGSEHPQGGTASPGPSAGKHTGSGGDAALRAVYADISKRNKLYDRLSKVVGAFDAAIDVTTCTAADIASYGVKKLKLNAPKGQEFIALDAYLSGVEAARRAAPTVAKRAADAASEVPVIAAYFKE